MGRIGSQIKERSLRNPQSFLLFLGDLAVKKFHHLQVFPSSGSEDYFRLRRLGFSVLPDLLNFPGFPGLA